MTATALSPSLVEDFRRDGFVVVPDLLSADELPPVRRGGRRGGRRPQPARHATAGREVALRAELHPVPEPVGGLPRRPAADVPPAPRRDGGPAARRRRRAALARPGALQGAGRARDRPAPGPAVLADRRDRHDHRVDPLRRLDARRAAPWATCRAATGSALREFVNIFTRAATVRTRWPGAELAGIEPVFVEVPPGAVAFHHGLTFHLAAAQRAPVPSVACTRSSTSPTVRPAASAASRIPRSSGPESRWARVIASDVTPLAWPRPDGDLPPAPAAPLR